jgi:hypothetical protein
VIVRKFENKKQQLQIKAELIRVPELLSKLINKYRIKKNHQNLWFFMKEPMVLGLVT